MGQNDKRETTDEVLQETRRIKETLARAMNFDIDQMLKEARVKQQVSGRKVLTPPTRQDA